MKTNEFIEWLKHHCSTFPGLLAWFERLDDMKFTRSQWERTLTEITLAEAKAATDEMIKDEELIPEGFSRHPARVRLIAKRARRLNNSNGDGQQFLHGQRVYDCPLCQDFGWVTVWHWDTMDDLRSGRPIEWPREDGRKIPVDQIPTDERPVRQNTMAIFCNCARGQYRRDNSSRRKSIPTFNASRFVRWDGYTDLEELQDHINRQGER